MTALHALHELQPKHVMLELKVMRGCTAVQACSVEERDGPSGSGSG